ncbi:hypothetical protein [Vibrio cionasavignyae]|uniref:hypothetical protein n=1 Tax=Vibrio cionasavignyae TaxID=2910252 RepID=UPI003D0B8F38
MINNVDSKSPATNFSKNSVYRFLCEIDWSLGRMLANTIKLVLFLTTTVIAFFFLYITFADVFEYQDGLADLSSIEILFAVLSVILLDRYIRYSRRTTVEWWLLIVKPITWYGIFVLCAWFVASIFAFIDLWKGTSYVSWGLLRSENYSQALSFIFVLISLYISVPSKTSRLSDNINSSKTETETANPIHSTNPQPTAKAEI